MMSSLIAAVFAVAAAPDTASASVIRGEYVEARTNDIYTGPCFSNAEVFIKGDQGVVAWKIAKGQFQGVKLDGLSVAAAIQGNTTFSEDNPKKARAFIMVDKKADAKQREALVAFAKHMAGDRLNNIVAVKPTLISMMVEDPKLTGTAEQNKQSQEAGHGKHDAETSGSAMFWSPGMAEILVRPIGHGDHMCGNEVIAYDPLSRDVQVQPGFAMSHWFQDKSLGGIWSVQGNRGAFSGTFSTSVPSSK